MTRPVRRLLVWSGLIAALVVAHALLGRSLAGSSTAAALLAPNPQLPVGPALLVGGFVLLRLFLFLLLPGLVLAKAVVGLVRWTVERRGRRTPGR